MSIFTDEVISNNKGVKSYYQAVNSNSSCSSSSAFVVSSHAVTTNFGFVDRGKLRLSPNTGRRGEGRTKLVGAKASPNGTKELSFNFTATSNSIRCFFKRMWSLLSGTKNWGTLDSFGKDGSYKFCYTNSVINLEKYGVCFTFFTFM